MVLKYMDARNEHGVDVCNSQGRNTNPVDWNGDKCGAMIMTIFNGLNGRGVDSNVVCD
jgi:hypothetical protein